MSDDVEITLIETKDQYRVLDFLRIHYYPEEPLTIGSVPREQDKADEEFNISNIKNGSSIMALQNNKIVGVILSGPKYVNESEHLLEEANYLGPTKWGQILKFLAYIEGGANVYEKFGVFNALHGHVLAVDKHLRGKQIGKQLLQKLMLVGIQKKYPLLTLDCTSVYSANLCKRLDFECVYTCYYKDYVNDEGVQIFNPPTPHDCIKTFAIRLN